MQKYVSFRIHKNTYVKLRKQRDKQKLKSIDELINQLLKVEEQPTESIWKIYPISS
jgi:hypothetical protein